MLGRHIERLLHALTYSDRWNDDDELGPAVALVQLHDCLDVDIGLAGASLHLDVEIRSPRSRLAVYKFLRQRQVSRSLHLVNVV